jgi:hypothetical protein
MTTYCSCIKGPHHNIKDGICQGCDLPVSPDDMPATSAQLAIGTRIKCIHKYPGPFDRYGQIATITGIDHKGPNIETIYVKWDDSAQHSFMWGAPWYFSLLTNDQVKDPIVQTSAGPVNDHVCKTCKNDRVSKTEVRCWKCGNKL